MSFTPEFTTIYPTGEKWFRLFRETVWETGTGAEMFVGNDQIWAFVRREGEWALERDAHVASIARTNPGGLMDVKLEELTKLPRRNAQRAK